MMGSWERDIGRTEKQKRKNIVVLFSRVKPFLIRRFVSQKYTRTHTYSVFVLSATLREGTYLHCQEYISRLSKLLSSKGISLQTRTHFQ
jgi:hypothetical protein